MEYAVKKFLSLTKNTPSNTDLLIQGKEILVQLEAASQERKGILTNYEIKCKKLPLTKVSSVDTLLSYMSQKANEYYINFDISLSGSIQYLINNIINESDLRTLLADLIENAIIATNHYSYQ